MNALIRFTADTLTLGAIIVGMSLAVAALSQAMHAGVRFVTVDKLPLRTAIPLALIYPLLGPARLARFLYQERRQSALAASMAAHPAGGSLAAELARCKANHPSSRSLGSTDTRHLRLVKDDNNVA
ncbi:hypothetical protein [Tessaracoccus sp.]